MKPVLVKHAAEPLAIPQDRDDNYQLYTAGCEAEIIYCKEDFVWSLQNFYFLQKDEKIHPQFGKYYFRENPFLQERFLDNSNVIFNLPVEERKQWSQIQTFSGNCPLLFFHGENIEEYFDIHEQLTKALDRVVSNRLHWAKTKKLFLDYILFYITPDLNNPKHFIISLDVLMYSPIN